MSTRKRASGCWQALLAVGAATLLAVACGNDVNTDSTTQSAGAGPADSGGAPAESGGVGGDPSGGKSGAAPSDAGAGGSAWAGAAGAAADAGGAPDAAAGAVGLQAGAGSSASGGAAALDDSAAVAYRNDLAHSGKLAQGLAPPLNRLWSKTLTYSVSYPLIVGPRVFVSTLGDQGKPVVLAFDRLSGAALWVSKPLATERGGAANIAYDRGQIFAADDGGYVMAVSAETGDIAWNIRLMPIYAFGTMPVASNGVVFLTGAVTDGKGALFALDERDGSLIYRGVAQGVGQVTQAASRLYTASGCHETKATEPGTGTELWHYAEGCDGGGDNVIVFDNDRLFVNDDLTTVVLNAANGKLLSTIDSTISGIWPLSVTGDLALFAEYRARGGELRAFELPAGTEAWSVRLDNTPVLPLLLTPGYAFVATQATLGDTQLQVVDLNKPALVWTSAQPAAARDAGFTQSGLRPAQGLAAAQGCIVTAFERTLSVFASVK